MEEVGSPSSCCLGTCPDSFGLQTHIAPSVSSHCFPTLSCLVTSSKSSFAPSFLVELLLGICLVHKRSVCACILASSCNCAIYPRPLSLSNTENCLLAPLETESLRPPCQLGWFLVLWLIVAYLLCCTVDILCPSMPF